jgi:hypothetical protein
MVGVFRFNIWMLKQRKLSQFQEGALSRKNDNEAPRPTHDLFHPSRAYLYPRGKLCHLLAASRPNLDRAEAANTAVEKYAEGVPAFLQGPQVSRLMRARSFGEKVETQLL